MRFSFFLVLRLLYIARVVGVDGGAALVTGLGRLNSRRKKAAAATSRGGSGGTRGGSWPSRSQTAPDPRLFYGLGHESTRG
ncbi:hypothetical protein PR003_g28974 [Phytophthora rubi]|uniref:RxLR effector protein n=1 Tax=Phytophthora rubi TaxID=129364 RepID=A0A6A3HJK0_9STRA|nr:hypothetical protein PR001_g27901 [Phytophthora rubi]KAE8968854.1 hypothetical protein PR002_g27616 [Phytophthora rubi]KAE9276770.1 hypothetical protein PR003_g28974 [Phytophthora rubi]